MTLHLNALQVAVKSNGEVTRETLQFALGLNIVRAPNSAGKSTFMKAIPYALGLEGAFGPQHIPPFSHHMTDRIRVAGEERTVEESWVRLEISNGERTAVLRRDVKARQGRDARIITVWEDARLGENLGPGIDYYARVGGAARNERGVNHWLADFVNWQVPMVPQRDGTESPLYLESLLPTFFVEQKHGWFGILGNMPYHLGIRDVRIRALEFILSLESAEVARRREIIRLALEEVKSQWGYRAQSLKSVSASLGVLRNLPNSPIFGFDPAKVSVMVSGQNDQWVPLADDIQADLARLRALPTVAERSVRDSDPRLAAELKKTQDELAGLETVGREALQEEAQERAQLNATRERLRDIEEQLRKFQDLKKLQDWGSVENLSVHDEHCPVCRQAVSDTLLRQQQRLQVMTLPENVGYLKSQRETFQALVTASTRALEARSSRVEAIRAEQAVRRARIRALREELTQDPRVPSTDVIRARVVLEERIRQRELLRDRIEEQTSGFSALSERFMALEAERKGLPEGEVTPNDEAKLAALQASLWDQLEQYNFTSLSVESILISRASYQPSHAGYDLGHDLSASDTIRTIWAFLAGMLEVARDHPTNHPGMLVLDEPRQQHAEAISYQALLRRMSDSKEHGQQVIFATSEERENIEQMLTGRDAKIFNFDGRILGGAHATR